jgi:hypothetical protein
MKVSKVLFGLMQIKRVEERCGWPEGEAKLSDCTLIQKAAPEYRQKLLEDMAAMPGNDARKRYAQHRLQSATGAVMT